jgi:peptidoglycan/LPS O-acetylase OafA/YrhL
MKRASRVVYAVLSWAFVLGLLAQVFLIGLGLFSDPSAIALHRDFGWILHLVPLLILLFAALSRAGRRHWLWALALAIVIFIVPIFAIMRSTSPVTAALHPVAAVLAFVIAVVVAFNSLEALRQPKDLVLTG